MRKKLVVILGDVISSSRMRNRENFQKKLQGICQKINSVYSKDIAANFKILKGIDEIGGVFYSLKHAYEIMTLMNEFIYPYSIRFVLVYDYVDTALNVGDIAKMDGIAFHKASQLMSKLKKSKLACDINIGNPVVDIAISGQINAIFLLKSKWSRRQHEVAKNYRAMDNQHRVARHMEISQQAVSKVLHTIMWKETALLEQKLNLLLNDYELKPMAKKKRSR